MAQRGEPQKSATGPSLRTARPRDEPRSGESKGLLRAQIGGTLRSALTYTGRVESLYRRGRARIYPCVSGHTIHGALALVVKSRLVFERTFFITTVTAARKPLFRSPRLAEPFIATMYEYRKQEKFFLHEFVVMPDHLHLLLTPNMRISLERCMQLIKGGFSFRCSKELKMKREIWQPGSENHRIRDESDYQTHKAYIHMNPVRARLVTNPSDFPYSSANPRFELDLPQRLKPAVLGN